MDKIDVTRILKMDIELFVDDFDDEEHGEKAKLLHKHYTRIVKLVGLIE